MAGRRKDPRLDLIGKDAKSLFQRRHGNTHGHGSLRMGAGLHSTCAIRSPISGFSKILRRTLSMPDHGPGVLWVPVMDARMVGRSSSCLIGTGVFNSIGSRQMARARPRR